MNLKGNNSAGYIVLYQEHIRENKIYHPALVKKERRTII